MWMIWSQRLRFSMAQTSLEKNVEAAAKKARFASRDMALLTSDVKDEALRRMAKALVANTSALIRENKKDLDAGRKSKLSSALIDRLTLNEKRIKGMADSLLEMIKIKDPVGEVIKTTRRPNGLLIKKVRVPIGVIGIIFESRPNVTSDCIGLCLKSGNAVFLKGGREAYHSNKAIYEVLIRSLRGTQVPVDGLQLLSSTDRGAIHHLLKMDKYVDVIIPRGGEGLIRFVAENTTIPVIKHYKGVCHTYVSASADIEMARRICMNAKVQRPGVCNAMETMLVHKSIAKKFLPIIIADMKDAGVEIRADEKTRQVVRDGLKKATNDDWYAEYLDLILAVKVVDSTKEAIDHINNYGSAHSDAIVTKNQEEAEQFLKAVDSSSVFVNTSTRFADGFEYGFGAEVGISTDKLHARGPMALEELTTYKYIVQGKGQVRQ